METMTEKVEQWAVVELFGHKVKEIEKDTAKVVDDMHVKLPDGRVVPLTKRCFRYRKGKLTDGRPVEVDINDQIYLRQGGALVRPIPKLGKAAKKAAKRERVKARREVAND